MTVSTLVSEQLVCLNTSILVLRADLDVLCTEIFNVTQNEWETIVVYTVTCERPKNETKHHLIAPWWQAA